MITKIEAAGSAIPQWSASFGESKSEHFGSVADECSLAGLTELLLKDQTRLDALTRDEGRQPFLIPRFLAVGLASFGAFGLALALLFLAAPAAALPEVVADQWTANPSGAAAALWLAYTFGFVIATGICLPSFYFYGLLSGIQVSWLQVTSQIMKGKASTAMMLLGLLPIYVSLVLGAIVFHLPETMLQQVLIIGLGLPFVAGFWGVRSIYQGFMGLADTLPPQRRCRRECFLRRLTLACSACYSAVTPVLVYTMWKYFAEQLPVIRL